MTRQTTHLLGQSSESPYSFLLLFSLLTLIYIGIWKESSLPIFIMVRLSLVASLFAAVASAVTVEQIGNKKGTTRLPGAYIFEFEDESVCFHVESVNWLSGNPNSL